MLLRDRQEVRQPDGAEEADSDVVEVRLAFCNVIHGKVDVFFIKVILGCLF